VCLSTLEPRSCFFTALLDFFLLFHFSQPASPRGEASSSSATSSGRGQLHRSWSNNEVLAPAFKELSDDEMAALEASGDEQLSKEKEEEEGDMGESTQGGASSFSSAHVLSDSTYLSKHAVMLDTMKRRIEQLKEDYQKSTSANKSSKSKSSHKTGANHRARSKSGAAAAASASSPKPPVQEAQGL